MIGTSLVGCATKRDVRDLGAEIRELQAQTQVLVRQLQQAQGAQGDSLSALSRNLLDSRAEILRRLTGVEDQLLTVQELAGLSQQQLSVLRDDMERNRQSSFGGGQGGFPPDAGGGSGAAELYDTGVTQFNRESYSAARLAFEELVDRFPLDQNAGEARYYLAEIAYEEGDIEGAIDAALQVLEFFPDSYSAPNALYRAGMWSLELGETDRAREYFERVVDTWPNSPPAPLAEQQLGNL